MDVLSVVTGALPQLGVVGVALVFLIVFQRIRRADQRDLRQQLAEERAYFQQERDALRTATQEDVAALRSSTAEERARMREEMRELRAENRDLETELDRVRAAYRQDPATTRLPGVGSRHGVGA